MLTAEQKWGNSMENRIPTLYTKELELQNGSTVAMSEQDKKGN